MMQSHLNEIITKIDEDTLPESTPLLVRQDAQEKHYDAVREDNPSWFQNILAFFKKVNNKKQ